MALYSAGHVRVEGVYSHLATTFVTIRAVTPAPGPNWPRLPRCWTILTQQASPPLAHIGSSTGLIGFAHEVLHGPSQCAAHRFFVLRIYGSRAHDWPQMPIPVAEIRARIMLCAPLRLAPPWAIMGTMS